MRTAVIFSGDYDFQVLMVVQVFDCEEAWSLANNMFSDHSTIEHYDVAMFDDLSEANEYMLSQVEESRPTKQ